MKTEPKQVHCPRCNRRVQPSGEASVDGKSFTIYQCDECLSPTHFAGEILDLPYMFCIGPDGKPFVPENLLPE